MSKPLVYAELLSNIRQISVIATLDTPCDASTNVVLSANRREVILHHHGDTTSLKLPGAVVSNSRLQEPMLGSRELSWRLPVAGPPSRPNAEDAVSNGAPWPAKDLKEDIEFSCRSCGAVVLKKGIIKSWKDLPSENWAEMMDFWHCHKPDVPETNGNGHAEYSHDDLNVNRGYGANAKFTATLGVGFVDLTTFLVTESDCSSIEVSCFPSSSICILVKTGIKKATKPCFSDSMAWSPIQIPYINTIIFHSAPAAVFHAYPFLRTMGSVIGWRIKPRHFTPHLPQDLGRPWD